MAQVGISRSPGPISSGPDVGTVQRTEGAFVYTKEQLLALYKPRSELPEGFFQWSAVTTDRPTAPITAKPLDSDSSIQNDFAPGRGRGLRARGKTPGRGSPIIGSPGTPGRGKLPEWAEDDGDEDSKRWTGLGTQHRDILHELRDQEEGLVREEDLGTESDESGHDTFDQPISEILHTPLESMQPPSEDSNGVPLWMYVDPQGAAQGPFTAAEMNEWYEARFFPPTLPVKRVSDDHYSPLSDLAVDGPPDFFFNPRKHGLAGRAGSRSDRFGTPQQPQPQPDSLLALAQLQQQAMQQQQQQQQHMTPTQPVGRGTILSQQSPMIGQVYNPMGRGSIMQSPYNPLSGPLPAFVPQLGPGHFTSPFPMAPPPPSQQQQFQMMNDFATLGIGRGTPTPWGQQQQQQQQGGRGIAVSLRDIQQAQSLDGGQHYQQQQQQPQQQSWQPLQSSFDFDMYGQQIRQQPLQQHSAPMPMPMIPMQQQQHQQMMAPIQSQLPTPPPSQQQQPTQHQQQQQQKPQLPQPISQPQPSAPKPTTATEQQHTISAPAPPKQQTAQAVSQPTTVVAPVEEKPKVTEKPVVKPLTPAWGSAAVKPKKEPSQTLAEIQAQEEAEKKRKQAEKEALKAEQASLPSTPTGPWATGSARVKSLREIQEEEAARSKKTTQPQSITPAVPVSQITSSGGVSGGWPSLSQSATAPQPISLRDVQQEELARAPSSPTPVGRGSLWTGSSQPTTTGAVSKKQQQQQREIPPSILPGKGKGPSMKEIMEEEARRAREKKQEEDSAIASMQASQPIMSSVGAPTLSVWTTSRTSTIARSLREIQEEEERKRAPIQSSAPLPMSAPSGWAGVAKNPQTPQVGRSNSGTQSKQQTATSGSQSTAAPKTPTTAERPSEDDDLFWGGDDESPKKTALKVSSGLSQSQQKKKGKGGSQTNLSAELQTWTEQQVKKINSSIDVAMFTAYLAMQPEREIREVVQEWLGSSTPAHKFAEEFIQRLSFERH